MKKLSLALVMFAVAGTLGLTVAPALADSAASTRNIVLGAAALAGLAIEANVARKNQQANNISGYLPDGSTVYGDGRVVSRNGYSYYPGNNAQNVSCDNGQCNIADLDGNGTNGNGRYNGGGRGTSDRWKQNEDDRSQFVTGRHDGDHGNRDHDGDNWNRDHDGDNLNRDTRNSANRVGDSRDHNGNNR